MKEDRSKVYENYKGDKTGIGWSFLKYTRYYEADNIIASLRKRDEDLSKLTVLDYGSGVGDYGIRIGSEGSKIYFYDFAIQNDFVKYRIENNYKIDAEFLLIDKDTPFIKCDLVIFGEVLEHLPDPLSVLKFFVENKTKYIFTSSFPYRSDNPKDHYWHKGGHNPELVYVQPACRNLLESNYNFDKYAGEMRLWSLK